MAFGRAQVSKLTGNLSRRKADWLLKMAISFELEGYGRNYKLRREQVATIVQFIANPWKHNLPAEPDVLLGCVVLPLLE